MDMTVQCSASVDDIIKPFKLQVFFSIFIIIVSICGNACFVPQDVASERSKPCRISPVPTSPSRPKPSAAPPPRRSCPGVRAAQTQRRGFAVTQVEVLDATGSEALCKPIGRYDTLDLTPLLRRADDAFENAAQTLSELLRAALPLMPEASVLVVGLGNRAITPDAVGPDAMQSVLVTRHLRAQLPEQFGRFRSVAALTPGVLGTTGVESAELVRAMTDRLRPDAVIVVDALACAEPERLGCTVQLTDTGITPGSGVGNDRAGLDRTTLGVPGRGHRAARRSSTRAASRMTRAPSGCSSRRATSTQSCATPPNSSATASTSRCTTV